MKKTLVNLSNHHSKIWSDEQKKEWDYIIDVPFPEIPTHYTTKDVERIVDEYGKKLDKIIEAEDGKSLYIMVQGEPSFTCMMQNVIALDMIAGCWDFAYPVLERTTIEENGEKINKMKFVRWRIF